MFLSPGVDSSQETFIYLKSIKRVDLKHCLYKEEKKEKKTKENGNYVK